MRGGQVDLVLDELLPRVRAEWPVSTAGGDTTVSGQSYGGIAALWTIAQSRGEIRHAIAQSPSLWPFDLADAVIAGEWDSLEVHAGTFERDMLADATAFSARLRTAGCPVRLEAFEAGHDWAAWRVNLLRALARRHPGR